MVRILRTRIAQPAQPPRQANTTTTEGMIRRCKVLVHQHPLQHQLIIGRPREERALHIEPLLVESYSIEISSIEVLSH